MLRLVEAADRLRPGCPAASCCSARAGEEGRSREGRGEGRSRWSGGGRHRRGCGRGRCDRRHGGRRQGAQGSKEGDAAAQQQAQQQAQAAGQAQLDQFKKGFSACMEGKGYTAK